MNRQIKIASDHKVDRAKIASFVLSAYKKEEADLQFTNEKTRKDILNSINEKIEEQIEDWKNKDSVPDRDIKKAIQKIASMVIKKLPENSIIHQEGENYNEKVLKVISDVIDNTFKEYFAAQEVKKDSDSNKYSSLDFSSVPKAIQHLADFTGKKVIISSNSESRGQAMRSRIARKILKAVSLPGKEIQKVLEKYQGKKIDISTVKELITELVSEIEYSGDESKVTKDEIEEVWNELNDADVWKAMGIKVPSTHIKYASEDNDLIFASEEEALQHLANLTGDKILIASEDKEVEEYEFKDLGVEHEQYFQGAGTSSTDWEDVYEVVVENPRPCDGG